MEKSYLENSAEELRTTEYVKLCWNTRGCEGFGVRKKKKSVNLFMPFCSHRKRPSSKWCNRIQRKAFLFTKGLMSTAACFTFSVNSFDYCYYIIASYP